MLIRKLTANHVYIICGYTGTIQHTRASCSLQ